MVPLIDLHAHLDHSHFADKVDEILRRAEQANVRIIVSNGLNRESNRKALEFSKKYSIVKAALGMHPIDIPRHGTANKSENQQQDILDLDLGIELKFIEENKRNIFAVGEVGLDYKLGRDKEIQKGIFGRFINLAEKINKPIIVHSREAEQDCVEMLESSRIKKVVMHCFCGSDSLAKRIADNGWFFTIPTNVVRSHQIQLIANIAPVTQMFCETDSPYLSPFKGVMNEPAFVVESYRKIAELKKLEFEEVANNIFITWKRVFEQNQKI